VTVQPFTFKRSTQAQYIASDGERWLNAQLVLQQGGNSIHGQFPQQIGSY
jgi:hypothetical protein